MKKFEDLKISMNLSIGFVQDRLETEPLSNFIDEDEWNELSDAEKEKFMMDVFVIGLLIILSLADS